MNAQKIFDKFDGPASLARSLGKSPSTVYRWNYSKEKRGTGGIVPTSAQREIAELAQIMDVDIKDCYVPIDAS